MISKTFFSFRPRLKPYSVQPSEDHPTELVLIVKDTGAAIGVSHLEKRLIDMMNGKRKVAEIIKQILQQDLASLATLRQLLWDLDRYGFLKESPWSIQWEPEGKGYWNSSLPYSHYFTIRSIFGSLEAKLGALFSSPYFVGLTVILCLFSFIKEWTFLSQTPPLLISQSVALAMLVVFLSIIGGFILASWFSTLVLRSIHPAPVTCLTDYRYIIPIFRLDGRRLRVLPLKKSLLKAISPAGILVFLASLAILIGGQSQPPRSELLFHLAMSWFLVAFLLTVPWNSTLISREIVLRVRGESVWRLMAESVRKAIKRFWQSQSEQQPNEKLYIYWGSWTIISAFMLIRILASVFRWNIPILTDHFLREDNSLILSFLFFILALGGAAVFCVILTFLGWLMKETLNEVRHRFWPQRDHLIVISIASVLLFILIQIIWKLSPFNPAVMITLKFIFGFLLVLSGLYFWRREGLGFETWMNVFVALFGILLFASGINCIFKYSILRQIHLYGEQNTLAGTPFLHHPVISGFGFILMFLLFFYLIYIYAFKFRPLLPQRLLIVKTVSAVVSLLVAYFIIYDWLPISTSFMGKTARLLLLFISGACITGTLFIGNLRNYSTSSMILSFVLIFMAFQWELTHSSSFTMQIIVICFGSIISLSSLTLRSSACSKTALHLTHPNEPIPLRTELAFKDIYNEFLKAASDLYNARPNFPIPPESNEEGIRRFFQNARKLTGNWAMRSIIRHILIYLPWIEARRLFSMMPISVTVPYLKDWTKDRIAQTLTKVPTFAHGGNEVQQVEHKTRLALFDKGDTLIRQFQRENHLFIIMSGRVSVETDRTFGRSVLTILDKGDFVGEIGFLSWHRRTASVRALEPVVALCVHRDDIDQSTPKIQSILKEAETGDNWMHYLSQTTIGKDFPHSLITRVYLESRHITLNDGDTLRFGENETTHEIAVLLLGKATLVKDGTAEPIKTGIPLGLDESMKEIPFTGLIRASEPCRLLLINRELFMDAVTEILTPKPIFKSEGVEGLIFTPHNI